MCDMYVWQYKCIMYMYICNSCMIYVCMCVYVYKCKYIQSLSIGPSKELTLTELTIPL